MANKVSSLPRFTFWPWYLLREIFGSCDATQRLVYLSDGGHSGEPQPGGSEAADSQVRDEQAGAGHAIAARELDHQLAPRPEDQKADQAEQ